MMFSELELAGVFRIDPELLEDERGMFARTWCAREFDSHGLTPRFVQCSLSFNPARGTLRGMHYQAPPFQEDKLILCTRGAVYDVVIDLRPTSPTFARHAAVILSAANRQMLYVPKGFAHGFLTLECDTEIRYFMSEYYASDYARGVRWNDPAFAIQWPEEARVISDGDRSYPDIETLLQQGALR